MKTIQIKCIKKRRKYTQSNSCLYIVGMSVQVLWEAEDKTGVIVQEIYWRGSACGGKCGGCKGRQGEPQDLMWLTPVKGGREGRRGLLSSQKVLARLTGSSPGKAASWADPGICFGQIVTSGRKARFAWGGIKGPAKTWYKETQGFKVLIKKTHFLRTKMCHRTHINSVSLFF